ncbi:chemotaxis protein CheW [Trichocoleus sp. FACHB-262]|uniref:chemotaxis protein CheW n=1 Tax=Trichocoleus sp. FACHB-262 TaxID=2692869 RepID=UPI0016865FDE|nr:chemotaxis protein CheW [Trichocoleus sp. FACHB-262]MBD2122798.1 purine-binding chemotaxis protein CheW [Trichocoleus sp. FACHB-262]
MLPTPYLVFSLHGSLYGLEANLIQEIFYLPELTTAVEMPPDFIGLINLRGKVLPVMDLDRRFGRQPQDYQLSDSIIVLEWQELMIGILVNQVDEVKNLDLASIEVAVPYGREAETTSRFTAGIAKVDGEIITILNQKNLVRYPSVNEVLTSLEGVVEPASYSTSEFCPHLTAAEKAILRERAANLLQLPQNQDFTGLIPLAVVGLNGEYFGLDLKFVREFTDIRKITPVPCCPDHIIGNMNLRGEIVTLIDARSLLNLAGNPSHSGMKAMIVDIDGLIAGITVDEVFDVSYLQPSELKAVPTTLYSEGSNFLKGTAFYREKMMGILDISKVLDQGNLFVEEEL